MGMDQLGKGNRGRGHGGRGQQDGYGVPGWGPGGGRWRPVMTRPAPGSACAATIDSLESEFARMEISPSPAQHAASLGTNNTLWLCINGSPLQFDDKMIIYHYDVDLMPESLPMAVKTELFRVYAAHFPLQIVAYDGQRNLLSPGLLPEGDFRVAVRGRMLHIALKLLNVVPLQELHVDVKDVMYFF